MLPPRLLAFFFFCCGLPFKVERSLLAHSPLSLSLSLSLSCKMLSPKLISIKLKFAFPSKSCAQRDL